MVSLKGEKHKGPDFGSEIHYKALSKNGRFDILDE
jgi:hypothetical protein